MTPIRIFISSVQREFARTSRPKPSAIRRAIDTEGPRVNLLATRRTAEIGLPPVSPRPGGGDLRENVAGEVNSPLTAP